MQVPAYRAGCLHRHLSDSWTSLRLRVRGSSRYLASCLQCRVGPKQLFIQPWEWMKAKKSEWALREDFLRGRKEAVPEEGEGVPGWKNGVREKAGGVT